jgi:hypothetical protein
MAQGLLPEIVNGHYDPMAQQRNMGSMFAERAANVQALEDNARKDYMADAQMPSQISGFNLKDAQNKGELAALPQKLEIEATDRTHKQKFQVLQEMLAVLDDPQFPADVKQHLINRGIDMSTAISQGVPKEGKLANTEAASRAQTHATYFKELARNNPNGLRQAIKDSMAALSATGASVQAEQLEQVKGHEARKTALIEEQQFNPYERGGASDGIKVLEHYRKGRSDIAAEMNKELDKDSRARAIGIIVDDAGNIRAPNRQLTDVEQGIYNRLKADLDRKYGPSLQRANSMLQQVRKKYNLPYDEVAIGNTASGQQSGGLDANAAAAELARRKSQQQPK